MYDNLITGLYLMDPTDRQWDGNADMKTWRAFMAKYIPDGDLKDAGYYFAYGIAQTLMLVLRQCEGNFSRENIMRQAANIRDFIPATLIPGIKVATSATNFHPIRQMQLQRWTGQTWQRFGGVIEGANV